MTISRKHDILYLTSRKRDIFNVKKGDNKMQDLPKTKAQKEFEELAPVILKILSQLTTEELKHIFNYIVFTYNK